MFSIHAQTDLFWETFTDSTSKFTIERWRAVLLIEDAYKKRVQDALIDTLNSRIWTLENIRLSESGSYFEELSAERQKTKIANELVTYESSLKQIARNDATRLRKQNRRLKFILGGVGGFLIYKGVKAAMPP